MLGLYWLTDDFHLGPRVMRRMGGRVKLKRKFVLQLQDRRTVRQGGVMMGIFARIWHDGWHSTR